MFLTIHLIYSTAKNIFLADPSIQSSYARKLIASQSKIEKLFLKFQTVFIYQDIFANVLGKFYTVDNGRKRKIECQLTHLSFFLRILKEKKI